MGNSRTHHFANPGRVLQRAPDVCQRPPLVVQVLLDAAELGGEALDKVAKVFDRLQALAEVPGFRIKKIENVVNMSNYG